MKISKLFHWLYAILMFLPILVFIPNAFYYGFNEHAVAQEKTEQVPVYYQSNQVNTILDLIPGNVYTWVDNFSGSYPSVETNFIIIENNDVIRSQYGQITDNSTIYLRARTTNISLLITNSASGGNYYSIVINTPFNFVLRSIIENNITSQYINYFSICNQNYVSGYLPLVTNMSITDSMSYAWVSTWQNDLFSWSYNSFLTQPFLYITNLFNVPATNTLLYCLSYWLSISIIWLVFDVVLYVPLLVHRWLDKGIVE